jgi:hypothetical protein
MPASKQLDVRYRSLKTLADKICNSMVDLAPPPPLAPIQIEQHWIDTSMKEPKEAII